jgi:NCS1 family nucleobase:cation symporter-1
MSIETTNDTVGHVEQHGIDEIPLSQRHGRPRDLFWMWLGTNANVFYVINGALLIAFGLNFLQSIPVILIGNIVGFFLLGLTSIQGPKTGTATFAISRAAFGRNGGKLPAFFNWLTVVGFEGSGLALAVIALLTLAHSVGLTFSNDTWFKIAIILGVAIVQLFVPILGHATIMVVQRILSYVFVAFFVVVAILIAGKAQLFGGAPGPFATLTIGFALMVAGGGISWANTGSDYSRYLPENSSSRAIIFAASLGGMIPAILLEILGSAVASQVSNASDPISGLPAALPSWFLIPYLVVLFFNLLSVNGIDLYSSGLTLQTLGFNIKRWVATLIDMVICVVLAAIALFNTNFNTLYGQFLALLIVFLAPWCAIYLVDCLLRRNRYDTQGLLARLGGPYWYNNGVNWAGVISLILGMVASAMWLNSPLLTGPLSHLFNETDFSLFTGFIAGGLVYLIIAPLYNRQFQKAITQTEE